MRYYLSNLIYRRAGAVNGISAEPEAKLGESALIIQRDARDRDNETLAWMVGVDSRALALEDCGCGLSSQRRIISHNPTQGVVSVIFYHTSVLRCQMAFDCKDHYKPLTYGQYCKLMEIESDEEDDG